MLVVAANWAITDGTLVTHPRRRQHAWLAAVHRAAIRAGWCRDGGYRPIDGLDIVLAGDTFDGFTSAAWSGGLRPWQASQRAAEVRRSTRVRALRRGRWLLAGLRTWSRAGLPVPGVDRHRRPLPRLDAHVPVRVTLLAGDRDRWLEGAGGRAERHGFVVGTSWTDGLVSVWHGDPLDPLCGGHDDRPDTEADGVDAAAPRPTLAETIAVGLLSRFGRDLSAVPGAWPAARSLVGQLTRCLPAEMSAVLACWLRQAMHREELSSATTTAIIDRWRRAVDAWLREARALEPRCGHAVDGVDLVATALAVDAWSSAGSAWAPVASPSPPDSEAVGAGASYPLGLQPAVVVLGHRLERVAARPSNSGPTPGLLCLADGRLGPVTVCCQQDHHLLRVDALGMPDAELTPAGTWLQAASGGPDGLTVDAA